MASLAAELIQEKATEPRSRLADRGRPVRDRTAASWTLGTSGEEIEGVDPAVDIAAHLEVQVRPGAVPGAAHAPDKLALIGWIAASDFGAAQVSIQGLPSIAMVKHDDVPVAPVMPAGVDRNARVRGVYPVAL